MSYLSDVKSQLKEVFDEAFDHAWQEVVEPALKQSYKNGFDAGKAGQDPAAGNRPQPARRQWGQRRDRPAPSGKDGAS